MEYSALPCWATDCSASRPSQVRERMILPDGRSKVDPLSDHDFWMEKQP